jgi:hypothetical protein
MTDLKSIFPNVGDIFICPICFRKFALQDLSDDKLSDGHVWPRYLREKNGDKAKNQRVLLCKMCNSTAGSIGDNQMQLQKQLREGFESGELFGERRVELSSSLQKPIQLNSAGVTIDTQDGKRGTVTFATSRNNPNEIKRFAELMNKEKPFSISVYPFHKFEPDLAKVGWITSAYLLAFYTFGYRYIVQKGLRPIRERILNSFESDDRDKTELPSLQNATVQVCSTHFYPEPEIGLIIPAVGPTPGHLQVNFLDHHVTLPLLLVPDLLVAIIQSNIPNLEELYPRLVEQNGYLYIPIDCTKLDGHDCKWDYVLGKPIPGQT